LPQIGCLPYFYTWCGLSANLESGLKYAARGSLEMQDPKHHQKFSHLGTIAQLCRAISSQLRHSSTIGKNSLNSNMSSQYGELWPTSGWDPFISLGHPSKFQRVSHLGSVTTRHSSSERQPKSAAL